MLLSFLLFCSFTAMQITYAAQADIVSSTESTEFGANINTDTKNICDGEELEILTICAREVFRKLDDCKSDDLACECCALQTVKQDCHGVCPNTVSGNFLVVLHDECESVNDINDCDFSFNKHDVQVAKSVVRLPTEEKARDFVVHPALVNRSNESTLASYLVNPNVHVYNQSSTAIYSKDNESSKEEENDADVLRGHLRGALQSIFVIFIVFSVIELF